MKKKTPTFRLWGTTVFFLNKFLNIEKKTNTENKRKEERERKKNVQNMRDWENGGERLFFFLSFKRFHHVLRSRPLQFAAAWEFWMIWLRNSYIYIYIYWFVCTHVIFGDLLKNSEVWFFWLACLAKYYFVVVLRFFVFIWKIFF